MMRVKQISSAKNADDNFINMVTVETTQGHIFNIDLTRPYSLIVSGPTEQDIQYIVTTVYDLEHRNLQEERAIRRMNTLIDAFVENEARKAES